MVALLVLATFLVFITIDVLLNREKYSFRVAQPADDSGWKPVPTPVVAGVRLPEALSYHPAHTWAFDLGNGRARVGVDEFAASLIGRISRIEVPSRGRWLRQGEKGWTVIAENGEVALLAPAEGEIVAVNEKALADPGTVARDPYGAGWLLEIVSPDLQVSFRNLLSGTLARRWMEDTMTELRRMFSPSAVATALDGGHLAPDLGTSLEPERWRALAHHFFRS